MSEPITREEIIAASEAGEGPKLYAWARVIELLDSQQSKLEEMEEQKEAAYRSREGWRRCALDAEARVRELESQIEAAKVGGFNEARELAAQQCDMFVEAYSFCTPYPEGYVYSNEESRAFMIGARGRFKVAAENIRSTVADSKRGEE